MPFCFLGKEQNAFKRYLLYQLQESLMLTVRYARLLKEQNSDVEIFLNCLKFISFQDWRGVQFWV